MLRSPTSHHRLGRLAAILLLAGLALPDPAAAQVSIALSDHAPVRAAGTGDGAQDDVLALDDGDDAADDFFGFGDGSPFFWANRFTLGDVGFRLEALSFYMRTENAGQSTVYLAVLGGAGQEVLLEGTFATDLAPDGDWFVATLDAPLDFAPGATFFIEIGSVGGGIGFPAGIDGGVLGAQDAAVAYLAAGASDALEPVDASFRRDAFLVRAAGTFLRSNAAPSVVLAAPSAAAADSPLRVTAEVADDGDLGRVTLVYEAGGGPTSRTPMTAGPDGFEGTIPADAVTVRGVRYAVEAEDDAGLATRSPWRSPGVRVEGDGPSRALGWSDGRYRLVSVPLALDAAGVDAVFGDDLGAYDAERWRFYGLGASQAYAEHPATGALRPGRAFWLALRDGGQSFDTGGGTALPIDAPYGIDLHAGWNFVASPFAFDVPRAQVRLASGDALDLRAFADEWREYTGALRPFEGYALFVPAADRLEVWPTADGAPKSAPPPSDTPLDWWVRVIAETAQGRDADNVAATAPRAAAGWDAEDRAEPPAVGPYVTAYFAATSGPTPGLSRDVRPPAERAAWTLHVETEAPEPVRLLAPDLDALPPTHGAWLVDAETGRRHDLRAQPSLTFTSRGEREPRVFQLEVAPLRDEPPAPATLSLDLYPNPVGARASVRLRLAEPGPVRLAVHDALGRTVAVLRDGVLPAGEHSVGLEASSLPSGPYLLRLDAGERSVTRSFVHVR